MSVFLAKVERWRPAAFRQSFGLPVSWILAVIQNESGGEVGAISKLGLDDYGLMQTKPAVVDTYNANNRSAPVTLAEIKGKTDADAEKQIRVGAWLIRRCADRLHASNPQRWTWPAGTLRDEQILFSDLMYSAGITGFLNYRAEQIAAGRADNFAALEAAAPGIKTQIPKRKFGHARRVLDLTRRDMAAGGPQPTPPEPAPPQPQPPRPSPTPPTRPTTPAPLVAGSGGAAILLLIGLLALAAGRN